MALEKIDGVAEATIGGKTLNLKLSEDTALTQEAVEAALKGTGVKIKTFQKG